jgi:hypothetical protein
MPKDMACDYSTRLLRLLSIEEPILRTHIYITLESLFASLRLPEHHVEFCYQNLLENTPMIGDGALGDNDAMTTISYMQALSQSIINLHQTEGKAIMKKIPSVISTLLEFFVFEKERIQQATFASIRVS